MIQIKRNFLSKYAAQHYEGVEKNIRKNLKNKSGKVIDFINDNLENIIRGEPQELNEIIEKLSNLEMDGMKSIFNYEGFRTWQNYNAYTLANNLGLNVCPYCNRQYTFTLNSFDGKTRPEFDHFYSQNKYPYLALSFYNLIPSCHICNSNLKGSEEFSIKENIHPYIEGYENDAKFSIKLEPESGIDIFYGLENSFALELKFNNLNLEKQKRIENNFKVFQLKNLYNMHKDYVKEIIQKSISYDENYLNSLFLQFEGTLFKSIGEVQQMALSNYIQDDDFEKRVLSKLTRDISEELGII